MRIAIVGTAGRKQLIRPRHWDFAIDTAIDYLTKLPGEFSFNDIALVSGGAAGMDHVAVWLAANQEFKLELNLPCQWDMHKREFYDSGSEDWKVNPGWLANKYHKKFSESVIGDEDASLNQLHGIMLLSKTIVKVGKGFFDRNSGTAKVDHLLAFTFNKGDKPDDGGTFDTWKKAARNGAILTHISIPE